MSQESQHMTKGNRRFPVGAEWVFEAGVHFRVWAPGDVPWCW